MELPCKESYYGEDTKLPKIYEQEWQIGSGAGGRLSTGMEIVAENNLDFFVAYIPLGQKNWHTSLGFHKHYGVISTSTLNGFDFLIPSYLPIGKKQYNSVIFPKSSVISEVLQAYQYSNKSNGNITMGKYYNQNMIDFISGKMFRKFSRIENVVCTEDFRFYKNGVEVDFPPEIRGEYALGKRQLSSRVTEQLKDDIADFRFYGARAQVMQYQTDQNKMNELAKKITGVNGTVDTFYERIIDSSSQEYCTKFLDAVFPNRDKSKELEVEVNGKKYFLNANDRIFYDEQGKSYHGIEYNGGMVTLNEDKYIEEYTKEFCKDYIEKFESYIKSNHNLDFINNDIMYNPGLHLSVPDFEKLKIYYNKYVTNPLVIDKVLYKPYRNQYEFINGYTESFINVRDTEANQDNLKYQYRYPVNIQSIFDYSIPNEWVIHEKDLTSPDVDRNNTKVKTIWNTSLDLAYHTIRVPKPPEDGDIPEGDLVKYSINTLSPLIRLSTAIKYPVLNSLLAYQVDNKIYEKQIVYMLRKEGESVSGNTKTVIYTPMFKTNNIYINLNIGYYTEVAKNIDWSKIDPNNPSFTSDPFDRSNAKLQQVKFYPLHYIYDDVFKIPETTAFDIYKAYESLDYMNKNYFNFNYKKFSIKFNKQAKEWLDRNKDNMRVLTLQMIVGNDTKLYDIDNMTLDEWKIQTSTPSSKLVRVLPTNFIYYSDHAAWEREIKGTFWFPMYIPLPPYVIFIPYRRRIFQARHLPIQQGEFFYNCFDKYQNLYFKRFGMRFDLAERFENPGYYRAKKNKYQQTIDPNKGAPRMFMDRELGGKRKKYDPLLGREVTKGVGYMERPLSRGLGKEGVGKVRGKPTENEQQRYDDSVKEYGHFESFYKGNNAQWNQRYYMGQKFSFMPFLLQEIRDTLIMAKTGYVYTNYLCEVNNVSANNQWRTVVSYIPHRLPLYCWRKQLRVKKRQLSESEISSMTRAYSCVLLGNALVFKSKGKGYEVSFDLYTYKNDYASKYGISWSEEQVRENNIKGHLYRVDEGERGILSAEEFTFSTMYDDELRDRYNEGKDWQAFRIIVPYAYPPELRGYKKPEIVPTTSFTQAVKEAVEAKTSQDLLKIYNQYFKTKFEGVTGESKQNKLEIGNEYSKNVTDSTMMFLPVKGSDSIYKTIATKTIRQEGGATNEVSIFGLQNNTDSLDYNIYNLAYLQELYIGKLYNLGTPPTNIKVFDHVEVIEGDTANSISRTEMVDKLYKELIKGYNMPYLSRYGDNQQFMTLYNKKNTWLVQQFFSVQVTNSDSWQRLIFNKFYIVPDNIYWKKTSGVNNRIRLSDIVSKDSQISSEIKEGSESYKSVLLPMYEEVYKKMPYPAKHFYFTAYYTIDTWGDMIMPRKRAAGDGFDIARAVVVVVIMIVITIISWGQLAAATVAFTTAYIAALAAFIAALAATIAAILNLLAAFVFKGAIAAALAKAAKVFSTIAMVAGIVAMGAGLLSNICNGFASVSSMTTTQLVSLTLNLANTALTIINEVVKYYQNQKLNDQQKKIEAEQKLKEKLDEENKNLLEDLVKNTPLAEMNPDKFYNKMSADNPTNLSLFTDSTYDEMTNLEIYDIFE